MLQTLMESSLSQRIWHPSLQFFATTIKKIHITPNTNIPLVDQPKHQGLLQNHPLQQLPTSQPSPYLLIGQSISCVNFWVTLHYGGVALPPCGSVLETYHLQGQQYCVLLIFRKSPRMVSEGVPLFHIDHRPLPNSTNPKLRVSSQPSKRYTVNVTKCMPNYGSTISPSPSPKPI